MVAFPRLLLSGLVLVAAAAGAGCSSEEAPENAPAQDADVLEYELFASTRQLGDADLALLTSSDETGVLSFSAEPPALAGVAPGQVILAPASAKTPAGLLRVVLSVERGTTSAFVLRTAAAPLQVAFRKLHVRMQRTAEPYAPDTSFVVGDTSPLTLRPQYTLAQGRGDRKQTYQIVVYDGDGDVKTTNDQIELDATLGGGFDYRLETDLSWGIVDTLPKVVTDCLESIAKLATSGEKPSCKVQDLLPEAKTTFHVDPFVTLDVNARGAASLAFEKDIFVGTVHLPPVPFGPIAFEPTVDVLARVEGGASARFDVGAFASAQVESSVTMSTKTPGAPQVSPPRLKDYKVEPRQPTVDLHASAKAKVGARLTLAAYGVVGPYATASGIAEISAAPLEDPCWKLRFAFETELGARVKTPALPVIGSIDLLNFRASPIRPIDEEVARGSCIVPPDPPQPPGSGPTPRTYQSPTFTPWAKELGGSVDGAFSQTGTFRLGFPELVPSIDGRWVAAGPFAFGLHKIDGEGALTWTSALAPPEGRVLRALRSVPTADAGIMALVAPPGIEAFVLAKTGQSGAVEWTRAYSLPEDCTSNVNHLVRDSGSGFLVVGRCTAGYGWMVHVDERGDVVRARTIHEQGSTVEPIAGVTSDGEIVVAGQVARSGELEQTFVTRLDAEDRPTVSTAFHCPERISMQPTTMIAAESGGVTVVGTANGPGFIARVRKDGVLGFARFPNLGLGVASDFILSSVAELPVTGMVFAGSTRNVSQDAPPSVIVAGVDSGGRTIWSNRYAVPGRALAIPALRLTDDGGVLVTAVAGPANGREGDLFAMKMHAKDGNLGGATAVTSSPVALEDYVCQMATRPFAPEVRDVVITTKEVVLQRR